MREPRQKQRFPEGGKDLYELLRLDYEPEFLMVWSSDYGLGRQLHRGEMSFEVEFDPMLYFWPVENRGVVVNLKHSVGADVMGRLVKTLQRDGARWASIVWSQPRSREERSLFGKDWLTKPIINFFPIALGPEDLP